MSDHLDWQDEGGHLAALQEKLNRHLAFIESGELVRKMPEMAGHAVHIEIVFSSGPTEHARQHFLEPAAAAIRSAGMRLSWRVLRSHP